MDTEELTVVDNDRKDTGQEGIGNHFKMMLTVIQGSELDFGKTYAIAEENFTLGRDKANAISVDDPKVSKKHCEILIIRVNDLLQIVIKDLGSTNGTYVNHEPVNHRILNSGDKITVGETVFRFSYNDEIEEEYHSRLFNFAATDSLTGLYNRRYVLNELEKHHKISKRNRRLFSIIVMDIDDFKKINDTYGHAAGDEFLKKVAFIINNTLREQDIAGRLGGEEFLLVLPETDLEGAYILAGRIRESIAAAEVIYAGQVIQATISSGVSQYNLEFPPRSTDTIFQHADHAMYKAKKSGKNKVIKAPMTKEHNLPGDG